MNRNRYGETERSMETLKSLKTSQYMYKYSRSIDQTIEWRHWNSHECIFNVE
jgi:hypothetical protein